jgi:hypothetical protein
MPDEHTTQQINKNRQRHYGSSSVRDAGLVRQETKTMRTRPLLSHRRRARTDEPERGLVTGRETGKAEEQRAFLGQSK